jgi:hypothetical protein|tara:strand:- start:202 stop:459 length:258 start_codon:yes stop_codon:yes gene_type:complete
MDNKDGMLASFVVAIAFWLMNISHAVSGTMWQSITYYVSGLGFLGVLIFSLNTIIRGEKNEKFLAWIYLITVLAALVSYFNQSIF